MHSTQTTGHGAFQLERLVQAMAAGEASALSGIYEQTVAKIFAIARCILGSKEDAEEVVCDVYTHAWRCAASYDPSRGSVIAWLSIMARNRAIDRTRQRRHSVSLDDEEHRSISEALIGVELGPEQLLSQVQTGSAVHRALSSLSPERRRMIELAFFQGLTHQEIAEAVGIRLGTVKSHVRRALLSLQGELSAHH